MKDCPFDINIERKKIKNLYIRVSPQDGAVRVSAPKRVALKDICAFVRANEAWIREEQQRVHKLRVNSSADKLFIQGETHYLFGRPYVLNVVFRAGLTKAEHDDQTIILHVPVDSSQSKKAAILEEWYRRQLRSQIVSIVEEYQVKMGVKVREIGIRKMKTRWGSCNSFAGRIWLNLDLVYRPIQCLEYVVVHEMVHLLELSHNHRFKRLMSEFLPDWRERGKQLELVT